MRPLDTTDLIEGIRAGDTVRLSRAITLLESRNPTHARQAMAVMDAVIDPSNNSQRIAITGVPGVGKSTFIEAIGHRFLHDGHRLAVLAIDPTSRRTKGSILGDKTRMTTLSHHPDVYVRPSPAGESLGGVARKTRETILLCEAAGYDTILVETVGVGQSETLVHSMVDLFIVLMLPGAGDELQGIKRGIMELADLIVLNKVEDHNRDLARHAVRQYKNALHLMPPKSSGWTAIVETCSASTGEHIDRVHDLVRRYFRDIEANGFKTRQRRDQQVQAFTETLRDLVWTRFADGTDQHRLHDLETRVRDGAMSPLQAALRMLDQS